jgi:hypothetical protein
MGFLQGSTPNTATTDQINSGSSGPGYMGPIVQPEKNFGDHLGDYASQKAPVMSALLHAITGGHDQGDNNVSAQMPQSAANLLPSSWTPPPQMSPDFSMLQENAKPKTGQLASIAKMFAGG